MGGGRGDLPEDTVFYLLLVVLVSQKVVRPMSSAGALQKGEGVTAKLLRLGAWVHMDNVTEPKRRSFPGNTAPLDRLSGSAMATKQSNRQR